MPGNFPGALLTRGRIYYCCCRALAFQTQVQIPDFGRWLLRVWWHQMSPLVHKISASHLALVPTCSPMIMILLGSRNTFRIIKSVLRVLSENGSEYAMKWINRDTCHHWGKWYSSVVLSWLFLEITWGNLKLLIPGSHSHGFWCDWSVVRSGHQNFF